MCFWGVITLISVSNFYIIAKTVEIWSKTGLSEQLGIARHLR